MIKGCKRESVSGSWMQRRKDTVDKLKTSFSVPLSRWEHSLLFLSLISETVSSAPNTTKALMMMRTMTLTLTTKDHPFIPSLDHQILQSLLFLFLFLSWKTSHLLHQLLQGNKLLDLLWFPRQKQGTWLDSTTKRSRRLKRTWSFQTALSLLSVCLLLFHQFTVPQKAPPSHQVSSTETQTTRPQWSLLLQFSHQPLALSSTSQLNISLFSRPWGPVLLLKSIWRWPWSLVLLVPFPTGQPPLRWPLPTLLLHLHHRVTCNSNLKFNLSPKFIIIPRVHILLHLLDRLTILFLLRTTFL